MSLRYVTNLLMSILKKPLILVGGGGHCVSCIDVIEQMDVYEIVGLVDTPDKVGTKLLGYTYLGTDADLKSLVREYKNAFVSVGQLRTNSARKSLIQKLLEYDAHIPTLISPRAYVAPSATIGRGSIVMHDALVNAQSTVGDFCILNSKSLVEHDCEVGSYSHISTGAILNGDVQLGADCFVGSHATVIQSVKIGANVVIGAGVTVKKNLSDHTLVKDNE